MTILGVAVRYGDLMVCLPKPARHHDCLHQLFAVVGVEKGHHSCSGPHQGFYTAEGRYLTREEAWRVVSETGVEPLPAPDGRVNASGRLYSEDLW